MGFLSDAVDFIFGGTDTSAQDAQISENQRREVLIAAESERARGDVIDLLSGAGGARDLGFAQAIKTLGGAAPQQLGAFQRGNIGAQEQLIAGLDPAMQAILGGNIDTSGLAPKAVDFNVGFRPAQATQNLGQNPALNQAIVAKTGFTGNFGAGGFQDFFRTLSPELQADVQNLITQFGGPSVETQDFGKRPELNRQIAALTGFTGDFGQGGFQEFRLDQDALTRALSGQLEFGSTGGGGAAAALGGLAVERPQDFGLNPELNRKLVEIFPDFTQDFGGGAFNEFLARQSPFAQTFAQEVIRQFG